MSFISKLTTVGALLMAGALAACGTPAEESTSSDELVVVTHDSFSIPDELKTQFAENSGLDVTYVTPGDGGALVNQLILTKDSPLGDVVFGIDNSFSARALDEGVIVDDTLTAIDFGDVCINADLAWFDANDLTVPATLDDLTKPEYENLLVVTHPAASSPGLAFLVATVGAKGEDGYLDYWTALADNGMKVVDGWSEAYYTEFSGADGQGNYPLVLSYATSPAFTLNDDATESTTTALLDTCFRQTEYAGIITGTENAEGAQAFIDFMLSDAVQSSIPEHMYMYPASETAEMPADWVSFAPLADNPIEVSDADISAGRDEWIRDWTQTVIG